MAHPSLLSLLESVGLDEEMEGTLKGRGTTPHTAPDPDPDPPIPSCSGYI